jgi:ribonuclease PH
MSERADGRTADEMRPVEISPGFMPAAEGSALISVGSTRVICTASVEDGVPGWREGSGKGWVTAEYAMLPRATDTRNARDSSRGGPSGRSREIQRLIGRSLRAVTRMERLGELTIWIDCDVLQADGGTRTASISGAFVALALAVAGLRREGRVAENPFTDSVAAISAGVVGGAAVLDLDYAEDSRAEVDLNLVATGAGELVEIQGTAEGAPFSRDRLDRLVELGLAGAGRIRDIQLDVLSGLDAWPPGEAAR